MKFTSLLLSLAVNLPLLAILNVGNARAFTFRTGYDENEDATGNTISPTTVLPPEKRVNSNDAFSNYLNDINGRKDFSESFENFSVQTPINGLSISLFDPTSNSNYTATFTYVDSNGNSVTNTPSTIQASDNNGATAFGTYPTDGQKAISIQSVNNFKIELDREISNFGFWGTDLGDTSNELTVELYNDNNKVGSKEIDFLGSNPGNSSVFFFGVNADNVNPGNGYTPDPNEVFDEIRLVSNLNSRDEIGLDQLVFAVDGVASDAGTNVPEPFTILGSVAALGFGGVLKKKLRGAETGK